MSRRLAATARVVRAALPLLAAAALTGPALAQSPAAGSATAPAAPPANSASSPDVNLTPRRVVFEPGDRGVKEVIVFNRTPATATYSIALVERVMTPDGNLVEGKEAAEQQGRLKSAAGWLRYSPRQVVLGPNSSQVVRLQARKPADLPPGEYRAHFTVTATPPQDAGLDVATAAGAASDKTISIKLTPVYGISIPVIVRNGEVPVSAAIEGVKLIQQGGRPAVQFAITRQGERSLYGGVEVFQLAGGKPKSIAQIKGLGVYPEIDRRLVTLALAEDAPKIGPGSRLKLVYTDDDAKPGAVLAETEVTLP